MQKKALLMIIVGVMLTIAASAQTNPWNGNWTNDDWGKIHFYQTSSGSTEATFDGYDIYPAGTITSTTISNDNWDRPYKLSGKWVQTLRPSEIGPEIESNSGEIELAMNSDYSITGSFKHTTGDWHTFTTASKT